MSKIVVSSEPIEWPSYIEPLLVSMELGGIPTDDEQEMINIHQKILKLDFPDAEEVYTYLRYHEDELYEVVSTKYPLEKYE
jgi:hypothetical protein